MSTQLHVIAPVCLEKAMAVHEKDTDLALLHLIENHVAAAVHHVVLVDCVYDFIFGKDANQRILSMQQCERILSRLDSLARMAVRQSRHKHLLRTATAPGAKRRRLCWIMARGMKRRRCPTDIGFDIKVALFVRIGAEKCRQFLDQSSSANGDVSVDVEQAQMQFGQFERIFLSIRGLLHLFCSEFSTSKTVIVFTILFCQACIYGAQKQQLVC